MSDKFPQTRNKLETREIKLYSSVMNRLYVVMFLIIFGLSTNSMSAPSLNNFEIKDTDKVYSKHDLAYFIDQGYELLLQETRGIRTAYVLKKDDQYVGCRTESLSKKTTCYLIVLKKNN